jgi:predicted nucleic acid-binding protein
MTALLDTGFLLAVLDADDDLHAPCTTALLNEPQPLLPDVVLPELSFMILRELGYTVLITFLQSIVRGELVVERTTADDLDRTTEILAKYADSRIDFVDCVITAMAERLAIQNILTVDRRHFQLFRPKHCSHFVILPS